jgi:two-component system OmpR family sensor kinase
MTAWYVALLAVVIAAVGAFLVLRLRADLTASIDAGLGPATHQIALGYRAEGLPEARDVSTTVLSGERAASQVLGADGRVAMAYGDPVARAPLLGAADRRRVLAGEPLRRTARLGPQHRRVRLAALATSRRGRPAIVVATASLAGADRSVHRLLVLLLVAGPAALLATALGGWWLARRALRPIDRLTSAAGAIGAGRLGDRLADPGTGDEVAHLAATLNGMLARIQDGVGEQRRLVADTSHELRSPLAAMRAELDVSLRADDLDAPARAVLESTREEVVRLARMVDDLLTLAGADEGRLGLALADADLGELAGDVARAMEPLAAAHGIGLRVDARAAPVTGDPDRLRQAIGNLVDNAIKHSPPGACVEIATAAEGDEAVVRVADAGPGIAPELRDRVFDRFFRADASRARATGGSGIGLAIVRELSAAHGGRAWVRPRPGGGSVFAIALALRRERRSPSRPARDRPAAALDA